MKAAIQKLSYALAQKHCAIAPVGDGRYVLTALRCFAKSHMVEAICCDVLPVLAARYRHYGLHIYISQTDVITKNWFFPASFSLSEIYDQLATNHRLLKDQDFATFDLEIDQTTSGEEQLVIGYFLPNGIYRRLNHHYGQYGWELAAIEPEGLLTKRKLNKDWQFEAQQQFKALWQDSSAIKKAAEDTLKLLDRDNGTV